MTFPPDETGFIQPHLYSDRANGGMPRFIVVHATRGATSMALQYQATKNWFASPNNPGSAAHIVISHEGQRCFFIPDDKAPRHSAGFGAAFWPGGWSFDDWGLHMELAQPAIQEPFTDACVERAALEAADWCRLYAITPERVIMLNQRGKRPRIAWSGIVGHEDTENGFKLGKTDPGNLFPWTRFINLVKGHLEEEEVAEVAAIVNKPDTSENYGFTKFPQPKPLFFKNEMERKEFARVYRIPTRPQVVDEMQWKVLTGEV